MNRTASSKYLTFALGQEEYAISVLKVREIIKMMDITSVPQLPPHVKGVINLRGRVVPIVDLRIKFGLPPVDYSERTCIVVVELNAAEGAGLTGLIVDAVHDVLTISREDLTDSADLYSGREPGYVESLARVKGRVKILLNIDRMLVADGGFAQAPA